MTTTYACCDCDQPFDDTPYPCVECGRMISPMICDPCYNAYNPTPYLGMCVPCCDEDI